MSKKAKITVRLLEGNKLVSDDMVSSQGGSVKHPDDLRGLSRRDKLDVIDAIKDWAKKGQGFRKDPLPKGFENLQNLKLNYLAYSGIKISISQAKKSRSNTEESRELTVTIPQTAFRKLLPAVLKARDSRDSLEGRLVLAAIGLSCGPGFLFGTACFLAPGVPIHYGLSALFSTTPGAVYGSFLIALAVSGIVLASVTVGRHVTLTRQAANEKRLFNANEVNGTSEEETVKKSSGPDNQGD